MNNREIYLQQINSMLAKLGWANDHPRILGWFAKHSPPLTWATISEAQAEKLSQHLQGVVRSTKAPASAPQAPIDLPDDIAAVRVELRRLGWDPHHPLVRDWCKRNGPGSFDAIATVECFQALASFLREQQAIRVDETRLRQLEREVGQLQQICFALIHALTKGLDAEITALFEVFKGEAK